MNMHYIVAIVPPDVVESLEEKLRNLHVGGITLTRVKGYGEYKNFFSNDWLSEYTKIEIFAEASKVDALLGVLRETGAADVPGSGIVAVIPVGMFLHRRAGAASHPHRLIHSNGRPHHEPQAAITAETARDFKVFYQAKKPGAGDHYTVDHIGGIFAFDPTGRLRLYIRPDAPVEAIAQDLQALLEPA